MSAPKTKWESHDDIMDDINMLSDFYDPSSGTVDALDLDIEEDTIPVQPESQACAALPEEYVEYAPDLDFQLPVSGQGKNHQATDFQERERDLRMVRMHMSLAESSFSEENSVKYYKQQSRMGRSKKASKKENGITVKNESTATETKSSEENSCEKLIVKESKSAGACEPSLLNGTGNKRRTRVNVAMQSIHLLHENKALVGGSSTPGMKGSKDSVKQTGVEVKAGKKDKLMDGNREITDEVVNMRCQGKTAFEISRESRSNNGNGNDAFIIDNSNFPSL